MQKITPFLWFDDQAEEAVKFYGSVFKNTKVTATTYYGEEGPGEKGSVMTIAFELDGNPFVALNGGPAFKFTEAVSFAVECATQEEVDYYWEKLQAGGGKELECGWLKDKYGLCWQVVPTVLWQMLAEKDPAKFHRAMQAMMQMTKFDIARLQQAYDGK
ncbi:MAG: VOC family protein [Chthoniobacterales bacterium]|nr:VOC family protein [Chthoniobacterales bacterium]